MIICHTIHAEENTKSTQDDLQRIRNLFEIYDQKFIGEYLNSISPGSWCRETINRWLKDKASPKLSHHQYEALQSLLPKPPPNYEFKFIDLFAGIGGIRKVFEEDGGQCIFTS